MADNSTNKARFWVGVLYNENMIEDWQDSLGDLLQLPYCYCVHDKDTISDSVEDRKVHTHIIIVFPNTTTYKHALSTFDRLSAPGRKAINKCMAIINIRHMYDYLIHDTDDCRKKGKYLYDKSERISGNLFDLGDYVQIGIAEKNRLLKDCVDVIREKRFTNFCDFMDYMLDMISDSDTECIELFDVIRINSGFLDRIIKGNYHKFLEINGRM